MKVGQLSEYKRLLIKSRLINEQTLDQVVQEVSYHEGKQALSITSIAKRLIEQNKITFWHHQLILRRRWMGFFIGKYKLLDLIGVGGMSKVFLAEHSYLARNLALKILTSSIAKDPIQVRRFYQEAQALAQLDHANIVTLHDLGEENQRHYMALDYVDGTDLQQLIDKQGSLAYLDSAEYLLQVADALELIHRTGFVHRDIKPANIVVDQQGKVKLLDMGLVLNLNNEEQSLTLLQEVDFLGTVDYVSPEQIEDSHDVDRGADIYSLGCTFYHMLTGQPPFPEGSATQRMMAHHSMPCTPIRKLRPSTPKALIDLCDEMLVKDAMKRIRSARIVRERLQTWITKQKAAQQPSTHVLDTHHRDPLGKFGELATFLDYRENRKAS